MVVGRGSGKVGVGEPFPMSSSSTLLILDPTAEREPIARRSAARMGGPTGTIGIIDISKPRGDIFCDEVESLLGQRYPGLEIVRLRKPTFAKPAPRDLREKIGQRCQGVIQALAD